MSEKIVILANSRKSGGRCVAGKDEEGNWIRLVKNTHDPIPVHEARSFCMLKVLEVEGLTKRRCRLYKYHTENSSYTRTRAIGNLSESKLVDLLDNPEDIFGTNKHVSEEVVQTLRESLLFVEVTNFKIYLKDFGNYGIKLRGDFTYNGRRYTDISVTDSVIENRIKKGWYPYQENYNEAYITISLGELFNGFAYKLISGVVIH